MLVVGVTGRAQHGKDTIGHLLVERYGFVRYGFADALKELALDVDPILTTDPEDGRPFGLYQLVAEQGWESAKQWSEVRRLLQALGVGVRELVSPDAWVHALHRRLLVERPERAVITDVRFPNEQEYIDQALSGWTFHVHRPYFDSGVSADHESERYVDDLPVSFSFENSGTVEELHELVAAFMDRVVLGEA